MPKYLECMQDLFLDIKYLYEYRLKCKLYSY